MFCSVRTSSSITSAASRKAAGLLMSSRRFTYTGECTAVPSEKSPNWMAPSCQSSSANHRLATRLSSCSILSYPFSARPPGAAWRLYSLYHLTATHRNIQPGDKTPQLIGEESVGRDAPVPLERVWHG